jgi:hypothetical protein
MLMGKRGAKPQFTDISCPNEVENSTVFLEKAIS